MLYEVITMNKFLFTIGLLLLLQSSIVYAKNKKEMESVLDRFLRYVVIDTKSDESSGVTPSTPGQRVLGEILVDELKAIGLSDAQIDSHGYVTATIPSTIDKDVPVVGFISHVDTSPDFSGKDVKPRVIKKYNGSDVVFV